MSLDVQRRADATRRRLWWAGAAGLLVVLLVALTVAAFLLGGDEGPERDTGAAPTTDAGRPTTEAAVALPVPGQPGEGWVPPARQVTLPAGGAQVDEYAVGFPRDPAGAAAAEVTKVRYTATLDYAQANTVMRIYAAPQLATVADESSTAAVRSKREQLAAPETGPAPADRVAVTRPIGVQWRELEDGRVEVQVLVQGEYRTPERSWERLAGAATVWEWVDEPGRGPDWRLVDADVPTAELAPIGTEAFNRAGWSAIVTEANP